MAGDACTDEDGVYVDATSGSGYLVCVDGTWQFTEDTPDVECFCLDTDSSDETSDAGDASVEEGGDASTGAGTSDSTDAEASSSSG
jgi:hypothetical protein